MIDSHAHLDMPEFDPDREAVLDRAAAAGVRSILCPIDIASERSRTVVLDLARRFPGVSAAAGLHPHQASDWREAQALTIAAMAAEGTIVAVGEIGLDYHYNFAAPERQKSVFREQLALAQRLGLSIIVHSRDAGSDIVEAVDEERFSRGGILHCFTGDWDFAAKMLDRGFWVSFAGIVTFPKAEVLRETARRVPLERLLVETDAPYLAPVPHRGAGRRNEPAYVVETARRIAELRGLAYPEFEARLAQNFAAFLRIRPAV